MASPDVVPKPPTSPRPPATPPGSPVYMLEDSPRVQVPQQVSIIDRFEHAVEKLVQALEKVDKTEDAKLKVTKHVEAEKPQIQALKLEYKLVDEVYIGLCMAITLLISPI